MSAATQIPVQKQNVGFKRVLVATDFSPPSQRALAYATAIARRYKSELYLAHAIPPEPREPIPLERVPELDRSRIEAEQQLKNIAKTFDADLRPHLVLEQGPVRDILDSIIQRENVDLLVLGTHGRGGLKKLALGSVAEQILRLASCPVLTIGPNVPAQDGTTPLEFRRVLFATDFGSAANRAFSHALSLAEDNHAKLVLLHMVPSLLNTDLGPAAYGPSSYAAEQYTDWQRTVRNESIKKLKALLPADAKLEEEPECVSGMDFLPEGILETAAARRIELIVMGANRTSSARVTAHMPWTLTHEVICHAKCPVLTCVG
jgi:nucleotide-binding universal stress UspA family protein